LLRVWKRGFLLPSKRTRPCSKMPRFCIGEGVGSRQGKESESQGRRQATGPLGGGVLGVDLGSNGRGKRRRGKKATEESAFSLQRRHRTRKVHHLAKKEKKNTQMAREEGVYRMTQKGERRCAEKGGGGGENMKIIRNGYRKKAVYGGESAVDAKEKEHGKY